jgi:hypothetical protein
LGCRLAAGLFSGGVSLIAGEDFVAAGCLAPLGQCSSSRLIRFREKFVQQKTKGLRAGLRKRPQDVCPDFGKIILIAVPNDPVVDRVWKYLESVI